MVNNLDKIKNNKKVKRYNLISIITGAFAFFGLVKGIESTNLEMIIIHNLLVFALFIIALIFQILHFLLIKNLSKKYNLKIDWKHYWFGFGKDKIKEK